MKTVLVIMLMAFTGIVMAQENGIRKGQFVYIQQTSSNNNIKDLKAELISELNNWGYWKITSSKEDADLIFDLQVDSHRGMTMTSWGGQTVIASAVLSDKNGTQRWRSEGFKASPNGSNNFNAGGAAVRKLVKGLRKSFR